MVGISCDFRKDGLDVSVNVRVCFSAERDVGAASSWQVFLKAVRNLGVVSSPIYAVYSNTHCCGCQEEAPGRKTCRKFRREMLGKVVSRITIVEVLAQGFKCWVRKVACSTLVFGLSKIDVMVFATHLIILVAKKERPIEEVRNICFYCIKILCLATTER